MRNALMAVGRSGFNPLQAYQSGQAIEANKLEIEAAERKKTQQDKEDAENAKMLDVGILGDQLPGGLSGAYATGMIETAKMFGYIDYSTGGEGSISEGNRKKVLEYYKANPKKYEKMNMEHLRNLQAKKKSLQAEMGEKGGGSDKKLQEQIEGVNQDIQMATAAAPEIKAVVEAQEVARKEKIVALQKEKEAQAKVDAAELEEERDIEAARVKAERGTTQKRLDRESKERIAGAKPPTLKTMKNKEGAWTYHHWDKDAKKWVDTGMVSKTESGTGKERERAILIAKMPQYETEAKEDPNRLYAQKAIRLDENAEPSVDAYGAPVVLPTFESIAGKRGAPKALMGMGEQWDDAVELQRLLNDPKVAEDFKREIDGGMLSRIKGMTANKLKKWMAERHILGDSNTAEAIRRMQRLASEERKLFMGVAVTELEIKSSLAWMPDAGDSYEDMLSKINLMAKEGEQHFRRYMDVYKDKANMAPYYKAWGLQRFYEHPDGTWSEKEPIYKDAQGNAARYLGDNKWEKL